MTKKKVRKKSSNFAGKLLTTQSSSTKFLKILNLEGYIGIPTFHHSNTNNQFLFVNGRVVAR